MILPNLLPSLLLASPTLHVAPTATLTLTTPTPPPTAFHAIQIQARATTTSWSALGCRSDASSRALTATSTASSGMTVEVCEAFCGSKGFSLAAVESGTQCFCGNSFVNGGGSSATGCTYLCSGNRAETCGGSYRMNVYSLYAGSAPATSATTTSTSSAASATWSSLGCRQDAASRALTGSSTQSNTMTVEVCEAFCQSGGYALAGVEDGTQCFCGNGFSNGQGASVSGCSYTCAGNKNEVCGGSYLLNVYSRVGATTTAAPTSTVTPAPTTTTSASASWASIGCRQDAASRALTGSSTQSSSMTVEVCESFCQSAGYALAGVEDGTQCFCGNGYSNGQGASVSGCSYTCAGNTNEICGGSYLLNVYSRIGASTTGTVATATTAVTMTGTSVTTTTTTSHATTTTMTTTSASSSPTTVTSNKYVIAHHIVGNTYPYAQSDWANDIALAAASGIDGFALNYGPDSWQPGHLSDAYAAALAYGPSFKLFLSADMSVLPSSGTGDATSLANQVKTFAGHPNQLTYNGGLVLSTFSGETSQFGYGSVNAGWQAVISQIGVAVTFIPAWFVDPSTFSSYSVLSGAFNWNGGWPMSNTDIDFSSDQQWLSGLNGKLYIAPVTPNFFTHYSPQTYNKNFIYRDDDNLYAVRWELLFSNRNSIALAEIITWNDYGESHYIGPIEGAQPNSQAWVNGFPHTAWLDMTSYYSTAFKTGSYPAMTKDKIYMYARPHPKDATASNDSVGRPTGYQNTDDNFYVVVFATASGTLTLSNPPSTTGATTASVTPGVNKFKQALSPSNGMRATLTRGGSTVLDLYPSPSDYTFNPNPQTYNFNAYVTMAST